MAEESTLRRDSGIRLRQDLDPFRALEAAQTVIERLRDEVERLGDALETQRERYERTLENERDERRAVISTRFDRNRRLMDEIAALREENARLVAERDSARWSQRRSADSVKNLRSELERTGHAYRASLKALRRSFEQQLEVA